MHLTIGSGTANELPVHRFRAVRLKSCLLSTSTASDLVVSELCTLRAGEASKQVTSKQKEFTRRVCKAPSRSFSNAHHLCFIAYAVGHNRRTKLPWLTMTCVQFVIRVSVPVLPWQGTPLLCLRT